MTSIDSTLSRSEPLISIFDQESAVEYGNEQYLVRDNGAVYRKNHHRRKARPLDNVWTFGRHTPVTGYMLIAGVPIHRIVCSAFRGPPPSKTHVVDHVDTNRANNRAENLRWLSRLENVLLNPISARRIELVYGSIENFFRDPARVSSDHSFPDVSWMRTVSHDEAAAARERLLNWASGGSLLKGGALGEWLYATTGRPKVAIEPEEFESRTPSAVQVRWKVPTEFPACPERVSDGALDDYASRLTFGSVFARNHYNESLVVQCALADDLVVVTRFAENNSVKDWAVAHVSIQGELFYHRSEGTVFRTPGSTEALLCADGQKLRRSFR